MALVALGLYPPLAGGVGELLMNSGWAFCDALPLSQSRVTISSSDSAPGIFFRNMPLYLHITTTLDRDLIFIKYSLIFIYNTLIWIAIIESPPVGTWPNVTVAIGQAKKKEAGVAAGAIGKERG